MLDTRNIIDEIKHLDSERIKLLYEERSLPFAVCVNNISGGLNMGVIMRSANFYGAREVLYYGKRHIDRRSSVGVYHYMTVKYLETLDELLKYKQKYCFVGIENNVESAVPISKASYKPNSLFIFGSEASGIDKETLDLCDEIIYIPSKGGATVRSLNVSTAAGIVLNDYVNKIEV